MAPQLFHASPRTAAASSMLSQNLLFVTLLSIDSIVAPFEQRARWLLSFGIGVGIGRSTAGSSFLGLTLWTRDEVLNRYHGCDLEKAWLDYHVAMPHGSGESMIRTPHIICPFPLCPHFALWLFTRNNAFLGVKRAYTMEYS